MGGLERRRGASSKGSYQTNWRALYTKQGKEKVAENYKEEMGSDIQEEILKEEDLFGEHPGEEENAEFSS